jgi:hypothetical protein
MDTLSGRRSLVAQQWSNAARIAAILGALALPTALRAQIEDISSADTSACVARIPASAMSRADVYLAAKVLIPFDTTEKLALAPALMMGRAAAFQVRDLLGGSATMIPAAEPLATWRDVDGALRVTVQRSGRVSFAEVDAKSARPSGGVLLLWNGIVAATEAGFKLEWPAGVTSDSIVFDLELDSEAPAEDGKAPPRDDTRVPLFTVMKPRFEPSREISPPRIAYPSSVPPHGIEGVVRLTFVVDTTGRAVTETVKDTWPFWRPRPTGAHGRYYDAFLQAVRRGLPTARYAPARVGGCPVKIWVTQAFEFTPAPRRP